MDRLCELRLAMNLYKAEEIQKKIACYFAEHYNSEGHTRMCSDMSRIETIEAEKFFQNAQELSSSKNKAISQDFIKDTSFTKATYAKPNDRSSKKQHQSLGSTNLAYSKRLQSEIKSLRKTITYSLTCKSS